MELECKPCLCCGVVMMYKGERITESSWKNKTWCGDACRHRWKKQGKPMPHREVRSLGELLDLGDDDEQIPQATLDEIEARKAEVRQRELQELVAAGGRYEAWLD